MFSRLGCSRLTFFIVILIIFINCKKRALGLRSMNMGNPINTEQHECRAFVSRYHEYLFFFRGSNIYWVDARIIEELRPDDLR